MRLGRSRHGPKGRRTYMGVDITVTCLMFVRGMKSASTRPVAHIPSCEACVYIRHECWERVLTDAVSILRQRRPQGPFLVRVFAIVIHVATVHAGGTRSPVSGTIRRSWSFPRVR
jgi:hypothetical protein